jgi:hypothetical protein
VVFCLVSPEGALSLHCGLQEGVLFSGLVSLLPPYDFSPSIVKRYESVWSFISKLKEYARA